MQQNIVCDVKNQQNDFMHKQYLTPFNKFSFAASGFGQNLIIGVVNSYILFFMTDIMIVPSIFVTVLMMTARVFDASNDPIMGTIVDSTKSKLGKLRPYLLVSPFLLLITTGLIYLVPPFSTTGKCIYVSVVYIMWGLAYTICDIPFWSIPATMTPNPNERVRFITFSRIFHAIGGALPMAMLPLFEIIFGEKEPKAYFIMGVSVAILGSALFSLAFFGTKERVQTTEKAPGFKESFRYLFQNKPLLIVVIGNILAFTRAIPISAGMYISNYLIRPETIPTIIVNGKNLFTVSFVNTFMVAGFGIAGFISMLFTPLLIKKWGYKQLYTFSILAGLSSMILLLALVLIPSIGANMYVFVICYLLMGLPYGLVCNLNYAMIAESVDYFEWKYGKRTEGTSASLQTFMNQMMTTFQAVLIPLILSLFHFAQPIKIDGRIVQQPQEQIALMGIMFMAIGLPIIGWIVNLLVIAKYPISGKFRQKMYEELSEKRTKTTTSNIYISE